MLKKIVTSIVTAIAVRVITDIIISRWGGAYLDWLEDHGL